MGRDNGLDGIELVLVDGDNLLHDVRGTRDEGGVAWLLPRLSEWRPEGVRIVVSLDGHPAPGESSRRRVTRGIEFHHSRSRSADDMLVGLLASRSFVDRPRTVVITRDRGLQARARGAGGQTRSVDWLMRQINDPGHQGSGTKPVGIGAGKPPAKRHFDPPHPNEEDRQGWQPGRGATRKRGNPRRKAKHLRRR
jgi:hypothetical protein